jgi:hypothetical protein
MAQQDDIIIISTVEEITTSILDYFLNIALVTAIETDDLVTGQTFSTTGIETFASSSELAEKFATTSKIYKIGRDVFNQKNNNGINQSGVRRLVVIKKEDTDASFEACLNRVGYKDSYWVLTNANENLDIESVDSWVSGYRKMQMAQTNTANVATSDTDDVASQLKAKNAGRTALYFHEDTTESLNGAMASILASYPVARKSASYKKPTGITVDKLSSSQESNLKNKNVNYFVPFIGGAGEYSTRYLTSDNGVVLSGDEIQKVVAIDRTVLSLQAALMDALEQDIPYDDNGGTVVYDKVNAVFAELKNDGVFAEDSLDEETGEMLKSYTIEVLTRAKTKAQYPSYFAQKMFIIKTTIQLAGSAKKIHLTLAY